MEREAQSRDERVMAFCGADVWLCEELVEIPVRGSRGSGEACVWVCAQIYQGLQAVEDLQVAMRIQDGFVVRGSCCRNCGRDGEKLLRHRNSRGEVEVEFTGDSGGEPSNGFLKS